MTNIIKEYNCQTGETIEREMTTAENKQFLDEQKYLIQKLETEKAEMETRQIQKAALLAKLGITEAEAKLLLA
jgi:hypothetical protein